MSWKFSKDEVPQYTPDLPFPLLGCVACGQADGTGAVDRDTGLCRPCWRVVVLGPYMERHYR